VQRIAASNGIGVSHSQMKMPGCSHTGWLRVSGVWLRHNLVATACLQEPSYHRAIPRSGSRVDRCWRGKCSTEVE
jgi:hypothetical protein